MTQTITNRIICASIIAVVGFLVGEGCALKPGLHLLPAAERMNPDHAPVLRVVSADAAAARVVCESAAHTGVFARIHCGGDEPADLELVVDTAVTDASRDFSRNAGWSLMTLTTALRVSTSARAHFRFRIGPPGGPYSVVQYRARGRIGMWSYLPVYTGFIATTLGTWLNEYRLPDNLRGECVVKSGGNVGGLMEPLASPACRDYREFIQDAYSKIRLDFWSAMREPALNFHRRAAARKRVRNTPAQFAKRGPGSRSSPY